jgi:hypothetical protein
MPIPKHVRDLQRRAERGKGSSEGGNASRSLNRHASCARNVGGSGELLVAKNAGRTGWRDLLHFVDLITEG